jgi:hypothetical protein
VCGAGRAVLRRAQPASTDRRAPTGDWGLGTDSDWGARQDTGAREKGLTVVALPEPFVPRLTRPSLDVLCRIASIAIHLHSLLFHTSPSPVFRPNPLTSPFIDQV